MFPYSLGSQRHSPTKEHKGAWEEIMDSQEVRHP